MFHADEAHLVGWLAAHVHADEREQVYRAIVRLTDEHPDLLTRGARSWPELRALAEGSK